MAIFYKRVETSTEVTFFYRYMVMAYLIVILGLVISTFIESISYPVWFVIGVCLFDLLIARREILKGMREGAVTITEKKLSSWIVTIHKNKESVDNNVGSG